MALTEKLTLLSPAAIVTLDGKSMSSGLAVPPERAARKTVMVSSAPPSGALVSSATSCTVSPSLRSLRRTELVEVSEVEVSDLTSYDRIRGHHNRWFHHDRRFIVIGNLKRNTGTVQERYLF